MNAIENKMMKEIGNHGNKFYFLRFFDEFVIIKQRETYSYLKLNVIWYFNEIIEWFRNQVIMEIIFLWYLA